MDGSGGQDAYALTAGMAGVPELAQARHQCCAIGSAGSPSSLTMAASTSSAAESGSGILKKD